VEHTARIKSLLEKSPNTHYCGVLKPEEIYETLGNYKCAVNPSKSEASPNAVIEAGACGLYLYLSDIPGHRNVGYSDVYYFDKDNIELPAVDACLQRSKVNVEHHRCNLSISKQILEYSKVYESF
jgi:glycosyltransferase involved in cell wall biosynthesis